MGCGCGGGSSAGTSGFQSPVIKNITAPENCSFNKETLETYKSLIEELKVSKNYKGTGITEKNVNGYIGLIQSALNYPDNYCLLEEQLTNFKINIFPKIVVNVS